MTQSCLSLFFSLTILVIACTTTPVTERRQLVLVPDDTMNQLGIEAYQEMLNTEPLSDNEELVELIKKVGQRIAAASDVDFDWQFALFDSEQVNAFCLPGGKIGVYTGILPFAKNTAGLAAILGHEVAHAVARHGAERVSQAMLIEGVLIGVNEAFRDKEHRGLIMGALGLGAQLGVMMPYSRRHESEADRIGLIYMAKAGYDPRQAAALWQRMGEDSARVPEFLSTHPDPQRRATELTRQVDKVWHYFEESQKQEITDIPL